MKVVGIDGTRRGWVAVVREAGDWRAVGLERLERAPDVLAGAGVIAVDMPIGLAEDGRRECDREGRERLRGRACTLFFAPAEGTTGVATYDEANRRSRELTGRGMSRQSYGLLRKIEEVAAFRVGARQVLCEVHPELSFAEMAGAVVAESKRTDAGRRRRIDLLEGQGIPAARLLGQRPVGAAVDDLLDAAAAAWSADRIAGGRAHHLPAHPVVAPGDATATIWV